MQLNIVSITIHRNNRPFVFPLLKNGSTLTQPVYVGDIAKALMGIMRVRMHIHIIVLFLICKSWPVYVCMYVCYVCMYVCIELSGL